MSSFWKLKALIKKNFLEMRRNILSTIVEIFLPIILIALFYILKTAYSVDNVDFVKDEINGKEEEIKEFVKNRGLVNKNFDDSGEWYDLSEAKQYFFSICDIGHYTQSPYPRPVIAIVNAKDFTEKINNTFNDVFKKIERDNLTLKFYSDIKDMEDEIKNNETSICFGISFEYKNDEKTNIETTLHYFEQINYFGIFDSGTPDIPSSQHVLEEFQIGPNMKGYEKYQTNGYTYVLKLISEIFLSNYKNEGISINFGIVPFRYEKYRLDEKFGEVIRILGPFFIVIAYLIPLMLYTYRMVLDKETKVKEGMKIMGLTDGVYFFSYFIIYFLISIFDTAAISFIFYEIYTIIPYQLFFIMFFLFSMNIFSLAFFLQSFINKAKESFIISMLIYFGMLFSAHIVAGEDKSYTSKVFMSLFPSAAIDLGIVLLGKFKRNFREFKFSDDIFEKYTNYSIFIMYLMLFIDIFIYLFFGYYFQNVMPKDYGIRKPWYFLFKKIFCIKSKEQRYNVKYQDGRITINNQEQEDIFGNEPVNDYFQSEDIYKDMINPKDCLRIKNCVKKFGDGKVAVNRVNLNLYKNEIFALLGHNGAGKTTLISILTGMYEATGGEAIYDSLNVLSPENVDKFREKIGICPQHDVLFGDLNVREHLEMFAIFKGVSSENVENEINKSLSDFQFQNMEGILAKNLSAGQRRKLSIAISLIGGSEIIFLDEPSSGMDITSRRNLWEILKRQSDNKIIILTTHYMEEASVLGNRIGIINLGKMKCIGTPLFLIEKFGKYMSINLSKDENANNDQIMSFISQKVEHPEFESLSEEIMVRIPKNNFSNDSGVSLNSFFEELDENLENLKIKSYTVSMPTLEDVFLNIAVEDESERISQRIKEEEKYDNLLFDSDYLDDSGNNSKFFSHFKANAKRRFKFLIRDKKGFLLEILCPIILVIFGALISKVNFFMHTKDFGSDDIKNLGNQKIYYNTIEKNNKIDLSKYHIDGVDFSDEECDFTETNDIVSYYTNFFYSISKEFESYEDHYIDMDINKEGYQGKYAGFLLLNEPNEEKKEFKFIEFINARLTQGVPVYTSAFLHQFIYNYTDGGLQLTFKNKILPKTKQQEEESNFQNFIIVIFFSISFSLIPSNFIFIIVREKNNNSKHLMRLSGLNIMAYWIVNFFFEILKYYLVGGICVAIVFLMDYDAPYLVEFYLLNGPTLIFFIYFMSFFFTNETTAQNIMLLINIMVGVLGPPVVIFLRMQESTADVGKGIQYFQSLFPSFTFAFSYFLSFIRQIIYQIEFDAVYNEDDLLKKFNLLLGPLVYLSCEFVVFLFILVLLEITSYLNICQTNNLLVEDSNIKDEGVLKEQQKVSRINIPSNNINNQSNDIKLDSGDDLKNNLIDNKNDEEEGDQKQYMITIKNLRKLYNNGTSKLFSCCCKSNGKVAVKNLSFCLEKGECFGLLGLNGAGKTTTFKCITQELYQNNGEIIFDGVNLKNNFKFIINKFGYCPQYDAIFEYLTVYENLEFYSKLKGVKEECMESLITALIKEMRLEEFTNKISGRLSGGNKRKLSVAIAMLCNPPVILLDEPSTGMDPEARRFMWSVIHKMSKKGKQSSVIMTTHSMDEAETLCKRMAIMVNGEFVCLGKANEIKDKYGYGYELNLRIKPMTEEQENKMYYNKFNLDNKVIVNRDNLSEILGLINRQSYEGEIKEGRLGAKLLRDMEKNNGISISNLINWIFYCENAIKFVKFGYDNFANIIIKENMDNNFLFKMKKKQKGGKSIGYLFGLYETHKDACFITEYSIQQTSLEQIFNQFSQNQMSTMVERNSTIVEEGDVENIHVSHDNEIFLTKHLMADLIGDDDIND